MTLLAAHPTAPAVAGAATGLEFQRLEPTIGARVHGVDLTRATDDQVRELRAAARRDKVLIFPGQHDLHPDTQIAFGRRLGEVTDGTPSSRASTRTHPEIYELDSADTGGFADIWHTDVTFVRRPPLGSILRAVVLPPTGGDTQWADLELAYESLSEPVRRLADQLVAVHDGTREWGYYLAQRQERTSGRARSSRALVPSSTLSSACTPRPGRRGLFVNPGFTSAIKGVSDAESRDILDILYAHITKPEHIVRHRWSVGDVVMWDNRSTVHYANRDYGNAAADDAPHHAPG